jgi:hypothetical protein
MLFDSNTRITTHNNMTKRIAELLVECGEDLSLHERYSGRNMYGEETCAVVGDEYSFKESLGNTVESLIHDQHSEETKDEFIKFLKSQERDSLGLTNIYY